MQGRPGHGALDLKPQAGPLALQVFEVVPVKRLHRSPLMLGGPDGASMAQMMAVTAWQAHSIRGAMAGALKRKGYTVVSAKAEVGRRWRIMQEAGQ